LIGLGSTLNRGTTFAHVWSKIKTKHSKDLFANKIPLKIYSFVDICTEKTFLPYWLEITSSSIFRAIWAGFLSSKSRKTVIPALRAQKSCSNSTKN
jgi:hypothetical protein